MKIAIAYNSLQAFWNHFEPKGVRTLCSRTPVYAYECIVTGEEEVLNEVKKFPGVVCL